MKIRTRARLPTTHPMNDLTTPTAHENAGAPTVTAHLTESERHRLLASERRRATLDALDDLPTPVALEDLADVVAGRECDADAPRTETVERVAISLHHTHLPKLADLGVLAYDPDAKRVSSLAR